MVAVAALTAAAAVTEVQWSSSLGPRSRYTGHKQPERAFDDAGLQAGQLRCCFLATAAVDEQQCCCCSSAKGQSAARVAAAVIVKAAQLE